MILILVRHGQSMADIENKLEGRYDSELTEIGYSQAKCTAEWIKENYKLTKVITSPLKRALHTAKIIAEATNASISTNEDLMEWDNGVLAGMLRCEANEKYPIPKGGRKPYESQFGMESQIDFRARVEKFWQEFTDTCQNDECVCIVAHGGTNNMIFTSLLNLPINNDIFVKFEDGSINIFKIDENKKVIIKLNFTEHLSN